MWIKLYKAITWIFSPLIDLYLKKRLRDGKEDPSRFRERLGYASIEKPKGYLVWVHAASVGEAMSVLPLAKKIKASFPSVHLLVTTGTVTSAAMIESRITGDIMHQYVPVDKVQCVQRFLRHWKPDLALWVESELWPNIVTSTYTSGCPIVLVNGRMSKSSFKKWRRYHSIAKNILECFSLCLAQTPEDAKRLRQLGARNVKYIGNLKFDALPLPADPAETGKLVQMIGERPLWMAASTHEGEEKTIIELHNILKDDHPNLLTIIAPRHPERGADIVQLARNEILVPAMRSKQQAISETTDIYIADTIGELGIFYRLSNIVFMGGSLIPHGGQNPLEPARLECAILTGQYVHNFQSIYEELTTASAASICKNKTELSNELNMLLFSYEKREKMAMNARDVMVAKEGVLDNYLDEVTPFIKPLMSLEHTRENT